MGPIQNRRQVVEIFWKLNEANGDEIGTVHQNNKVNPSSVAKSWGNTADLAASAAAVGIAKIVPRYTEVAKELSKN